MRQDHHSAHYRWLDVYKRQVYSCISAFNDYDSNGVLDPRESLIYIPDSVKNNSAEGAPVLVVFPGMTQAASTFMDLSLIHI